MAQALWVLRLPKKAKILVKSGQKVALGAQLARWGSKIYPAPVRGKVGRVQRGRVELYFRAEKMVGRGIGRGHCWGKLAICRRADFTRLNFSHRGQIVFLPRVNRLMAIKARVLGIKGLITYHCDLGEEAIDSLPILVLTDKVDWSGLKPKLAEKLLLLDADQGYLLIPHYGN